MKFLLPFLLSLLLYSYSFAQSEVEIERNSLAGIDQFGIVVNIERPKTLEVDNLTPGFIRSQIIEDLKDTPAIILGLGTLKQSYDYPFLHVHVNIMEAANGTYPFAIELRFYQPVKLILKRDITNMAATWHTGSVGIVSKDLLHTIAPTVIASVEEFKDEFEKVN